MAAGAGAAMNWLLYTKATAAEAGFGGKRLELFRFATAGKRSKTARFPHPWRAYGSVTRRTLLTLGTGTPLRIRLAGRIEPRPKPAATDELAIAVIE
jgi:hypothetical protein